jgi:tetratricopeptide (TPR) repeat protein
VKSRLLALGSFGLGSLLFSSAAAAQTSAVLGQKNAAFLTGLWRIGYTDYADKIGQLVAASNLVDKEKAEVGEVHRRLRIALTSLAGDALGRRDLALQTIDEKLAALANVKVGSQDHIETISELVDGCRIYADAVAEALKQDKPPEELATIRKAADEKLKAIIADLEARKKAYEPLRVEDKPETELPLLVAHYGLGRLHYYHALVHPADSLHAKHAIETSLTTLEEFDLDFSDSLAAYEAKLTIALCHKFLGDVEAALSACDDAIALRESYGEPKQGVYPVEKDGADVIAAAYVQKTLFWKDAKEWNKIEEAAKEFFATIPNPMDAQQGPAMLAAQAEAYLNLGDNGQAAATAQKLVDFDPKGRWGYRGQEILADINTTKAAGPVDVVKTLRTAELFASQGDYDKALRMCREALNGADRTKDEGKAQAAEALLITGAVYATRQWYHEASVAWDAVVRRFPKTPSAPDALYRTVQCYIELYEQDKLPVYKRWIDDRSKQLVREYPTDQRVPQLLLVEAQQVDRAGKFLEAAKIYENVAPESAVYLDARYYAATCYQKQARKVEASGQTGEVATLVGKAKSGFQSVLADVGARLATNPTDKVVLAKLTSVDTGTRIALGGLLLAEGNAAEADKLLAGVTIKDDDKQAPTIWALRIRSLLVAKKGAEAADALEAALAKAPEAKALVPICRSIAADLDAQAVERDKNKERTAASTIWRRAIFFYVKGATGANATEAGQIADRLRVIGMILNNVSEKAEGWFEVTGNALVAPQPWEAALELYTRLHESNEGNYKTSIGRARILGLMGRYKECETELSTLFSKENIKAANNRLDGEAIKKKPELLMAWLEWGYALLMLKGGEEKVARINANDTFSRVAVSVPQGGKYWWFSRYGQISALVEAGRYEEADVAFSSLERNNPDLDANQFGLQLKFRQLKTLIASKNPK